jgi:hypothetical protein
MSTKRPQTLVGVPLKRSTIDDVRTVKGFPLRHALEMLADTPTLFGKAEAARVLALERLLNTPVVSVDDKEPVSALEYARLVDAVHDVPELPNELWAIVFSHIVPCGEHEYAYDIRRWRRAFGQCCKDFCALFRDRVVRIRVTHSYLLNYRGCGPIRPDQWWLRLPRVRRFAVEPIACVAEDMTPIVSTFLSMVTEDEQRRACEVVLETHCILSPDTLKSLMGSVHTLHVPGMIMLRSAVCAANDLRQSAYRASLAIWGDHAAVVDGRICTQPGVAKQMRRDGWKSRLQHSYVMRAYNRYTVSQRANWHLERPPGAYPRVRLRVSEHTHAALLATADTDDELLHWWHVLDLQIDHTLTTVPEFGSAIVRIV